MRDSSHLRPDTTLVLAITGATGRGGSASVVSPVKILVARRRESQVKMMGTERDVTDR